MILFNVYLIFRMNYLIFIVPDFRKGIWEWIPIYTSMFCKSVGTVLDTKFSKQVVIFYTEIVIRIASYFFTRKRVKKIQVKILSVKYNFSKFYGNVGVIFWFLFHLIWKNYVLYWDINLKSWIVDYFFTPREKKTPQNTFPVKISV